MVVWTHYWLCCDSFTHCVTVTDIQLCGVTVIVWRYYQYCSVVNCVTQCSQSVAHLYEQFLQVKQIGFVTLDPLHCM